MVGKGQRNGRSQNIWCTKTNRKYMVGQNTQRPAGGHRVTESKQGVLTQCAHSYLFIFFYLAVGLYILCKSFNLDTYFLLCVDSDFVPYLTFLPPFKVINIFWHTHPAVSALGPEPFCSLVYLALCLNSSGSYNWNLEQTVCNALLWLLGEMLHPWLNCIE